MRVALVHDWLTGTRGGEKVLLELARLFPGAGVHTLFHFAGTVPAEIERLPIATTALQRVVSPELGYRTLLPFFFLAAETWDLSGYDLVISSSHCAAKNARKERDAFHLCYCHTPVRYLHEQFGEYLRGRAAPVRALAEAVRRPLARWDVATSHRPDAFLANSRNVADRIQRLYGRQAAVVAPPVDTAFYTPPAGPAGREGFLVVSALAPYKRLDDAVRAANQRGLPLTIAGFGPEEARLKAMAGPTVRFAGSPPDTELRRLYRGCEALLMPGEEDFGIVPLEAQACGAPVIALGRGGALETVVDGVTGVLYGEPGPEALLGAIDRARKLRLNAEALVRNAAAFSQETFRTRFAAALRSALREARRFDLLEALGAMSIIEKTS